MRLALCESHLQPNDIAIERSKYYEVIPRHLVHGPLRQIQDTILLRRDFANFCGRLISAHPGGTA